MKIFKQLIFHDALNLECPLGYAYQKGDVMGEDSAIKLPSGQMFIDLYSIENCKSMCDHEPKCKGMEWSPSKNKCILVKKQNADGPKYGDYFFCSKGKCVPMRLDVNVRGTPDN